MPLQGYDNFLYAINRYRNNETSFHEIRSVLVGSSAHTLGKELGYNKDLYTKLDAWFEFIEFCYLEEDWRGLVLSICDFIEDAILNEPRPLTLPKTDRVLKDQGLV
ncbi:hypothetical protein [Marinomonas transparens]|uniref:Uncharacterized protein n=1 Tax=Marinomonas transparens TaxID=2795388 RepID=A0A934JK59_9GAMM|nr:hypothetical protein [Marinomonas transparens]MBJ7537301.1 hypothetical protein [Marinomonas transparens]